jgi:alkylated DNA repair dioxygenase AlkB
MAIEAKRSERLDLAAPPPDGFVYAPEFITRDEEDSLLGAIKVLPLQEAKYKSYTAKRRIISFGASYDFDTNELSAAPPPPGFLMPLRGKVADWLGLPAERFAHVLVTEYRPATALGWHRDTPQFATVVGVSLGGWCRMRFRPYPPRKGTKQPVYALELEPRSAYVLQGNVRWRWQHSIPMTKNLRYSVTFRTLSTNEKIASRGLAGDSPDLWSYDG